ncbi:MULTISPECIES: hypothetical protein [unclassified Clostridium]|uniref:hypothetical protein n=1 Tax=unclassified Clostridium TaxID=2614128 RepID=UPI002079FE6D|nr:MULTISPECIES: hypothetical protein [unclassified Clostridium]
MKDLGLDIVKLGVDEIKQVPVKDFSSADRNTVIRAKFNELMGTEKGFDVMAYNRHKYDIFEILKETLQQTITDGQNSQDSFYSQFVEERNIAWGDKQEFEIENDAYLTVGEISGNNWNMDRQRIDKGAVFPVKTSAFYIKIYEYFKRFMTGRMDWAELAIKVDKAIAKHKSQFVAKVFKSAVDGLPTNFSYTGSYNKVEIQKVINHVAGANEGQTLTLVGTKGALNKLQDLTDVKISNEMANELHDVGFLRRWSGYNCVELPTSFEANSISNFIFDNDTIYILASDTKPVKIVNEGEVIVAETDDITSNQDMTKDFAIIWKMGGVAIFNRLFGVLDITA